MIIRIVHFHTGLGVYVSLGHSSVDGRRIVVAGLNSRWPNQREKNSACAKQASALHAQQDDRRHEEIFRQCRRCIDIQEIAAQKYQPYQSLVQAAEGRAKTFLVLLDLSQGRTQKTQQSQRVDRAETFGLAAPPGRE